jgi:hypothetical protein
MSASQATGLGEITDVKANEAWPKEVAVALNPAEARNWVIKQLLAFKEAFQPLLPEAATAAESASSQAESPPDMTDAE